MSGLPSPSILLGIPNFPQWYPGQSEAFDYAINWYHSPSRFLGLSLPTGSGKTVIALLLAKMSGARTCILTATKGLQDQYMRDCLPLGGVMVKGQNNFRCTLVPDLTAEEGPCHYGLACSFSRSGDCPYRAQVARALDSRIVVTNYAYYLAQTRYSSGLGEFDLLILDEGHQAFGALESHLTVYLDRMSIESLGLQFPTLPTSEIFAGLSRRKSKKASKTKDETDKTDTLTDTLTPPDLWVQWQLWASCSIPVTQNRVDKLDAEIRGVREKGDPVSGALSRSFRSAKSTLSKLKSLSGGTGNWISQKTHHGIRFTPRWVADKGLALFQSVPKIMVMSAILSHKTADSIGVPAGDDRSWLEVGSYFPPENTPIWHIPTARINYYSDDYGMTLWQARIDQIIQRRLDRKGIIFTVSYDRARLLLSRSRFKDYMLTHSTGDVTLVVDRFKKMAPPKVLVSPTVTTGWDFPEILYIVVGKIPYPDTKDLVLQARHEDDKDWSAFLAMETLIQECGRGTRAQEGIAGMCEVLIVDDNWVWWWPRYRDFAAKWFQERVRGSLTCVPDPLVCREEF